MIIHKLDFVNPLMHSHHSHFLPFDIEMPLWNSSNKLEECDIVPMLIPYSDNELTEKIQYLKNLGYKNQKILGLDIFHADDQVNDKKRYSSFKNLIRNNLTSNVAVVHTNKLNEDDIFYDFLWNRQKAYFTDYNKYDLNDRVWTWGTNIKMYGLTKLHKFPDRKKFLCPNRVQVHDGKILPHHRFICRKKLADHLSSKDGFISDPANNIILEPEQEEIKDSLLGGRSGTWYPVSNNLYNSSYVSIYIETITNTSEINFQYATITEKTWDPLIKGHFILPFGYMGIIEDIKSYGFWLPEWIDYSYDTIFDDNERFAMYLKSVDKILDMSFDELHKKFTDSINHLYDNRNLFWLRNYDNLYQKVKDYFNNLCN